MNGCAAASDVPIVDHTQPTVTFQLSSALTETGAGPSQLAFRNLVVDQLTRGGVVEPGRLYEVPFTGVAPTCPDGLDLSAGDHAGNCAAGHHGDGGGWMMPLPSEADRHPPLC